jgi:hypothetical protein
MLATIDVRFDFRQDTPIGRDPDIYSKTLRRYHKTLWSKRLPGGEFFLLDDVTPGSYLHHASHLGEFWLASDAVIPTFKWVPHVRRVIPQAELEAFNAVGYTIGGMMVFPGNQVDRKWTINQARGCTRKIGDRFDLTLECIRRFYGAEDSPLRSVLARYGLFFDLFRDFRGYVEFFLLQDLVTADYSAVRIAPPFDDFKSSPIPVGTDEYGAYMRAAAGFIEARNQRILSSSSGRAASSEAKA